MHSTLEITTPSDREIAMSRTFDAPRDHVFRALTTPSLVKRWLLGPPGWSMPVCEIDLRALGRYRYVWRSKDGREMGAGGVYREIAPNQRIVATETFDDPWYEGEALLTSTLTEHDGRTTLTMTARYASSAIRDGVLSSPMEDGVGASYDRLAQLLASEFAPERGPERGSDPASESDSDAFVISRLFNAPRDLVWRAWTDQGLLARWFGPEGVTIPHCSLDLRIGGLFIYCMRPKDNSGGGSGDEGGSGEHWGRWLFREISPPDRMVFVVAFADPSGNPVRAPFDPSWPLEVLSTVTFTEEQGGTRVTIRWEPISATDAELAAFRAGRDGMHGGWSGTFDKLQTFLENHQ